MSIDELPPEGLLLEVMPDRTGVLVVDGSMFSLNATACDLWAQRQRGIPQRAIAEQLVSRYGIDLDTATRDIAIAFSLPDARSRSEPYHSAYDMKDVTDGYAFTINRVEILSAKGDGKQIRRFPGSPLPPSGEKEALFSLAPNLLALSNEIALHGSAVLMRDGRALLLLGQSGAGKTTTARVLANALKTTVLAEDKLVFERTSAKEFRILRSGEASLSVWAERTQPSLSSTVWTKTEMEGELNKTDLVPLHAIWTLDISQRVDLCDVFKIENLTQAEAVTVLLSHMFRGQDTPVTHGARIAAARKIVLQVPTMRLFVPLGLEALEVAARHYSENTL